MAEYYASGWLNVNGKVIQVHNVPMDGNIQTDLKVRSDHKVAMLDGIKYLKVPDYFFQPNNDADPFNFFNNLKKNKKK
jgi:hypothetical protein